MYIVPGVGIFGVDSKKNLTFLYDLMTAELDSRILLQLFHGFPYFFHIYFPIADFLTSVFFEMFCLSDPELFYIWL